MNTLLLHLLRILMVLMLANLTACSSEIPSDLNNYLTDSCVTGRLLLTDLTQAPLQRNYFLPDMTPCPQIKLQ